jgi:cysteinyl-tRNA synthetase
MTLKIHNTATRKKESFSSINPRKVRMYVCGITTYDECHLGHARAAIVFDVIYRYLKHLDYDVTYIRNFTDIDDKIIKKSQDTGTPWQEITERYIQSYKTQMARLKVLNPTAEPKATEHLEEMKSLISTLVDKGYAYAAGGDVYFEVRKFKGYGSLAHKKIDELESGARIEVGEKKKDPLDFTLWKGAKPNEPKWASPWGEGRPGWHIECSAMSQKYLGPTFDIHGGGRDLMFPHHENEIAQSEAASGKKPFAKYWIHNGFVNINAEKMSKSLGNIRSMPAILEKWDAEVVRYFLISAHYASPLDFTEQAMTNAEEAVSRFYETLLRLKSAPDGDGEISFDFKKSLRGPMDDDFNTSAAIGKLFELIRQINKVLDRGKGIKPSHKQAVLNGLTTANEVLGIFNEEPAEFLKRQQQKRLEVSTIGEDEIRKLLDERKNARIARNFQRSDEIRDELTSKGVALKDNPDGTTSWEIRKS